MFVFHSVLDILTCTLSLSVVYITLHKWADGPFIIKDDLV